MAAFEVPTRVRLVFGAGSLARLPDLVGETGVARILLITDPGIVRAGHAGRVVALLEGAGWKVEVFDRVRENPDTDCVDDCLGVARRFHPDALVAIGGGSAMDTAKGCNFLLTNGGRMQDYWGVGKARHPMLPFFAIPTTSGTGSECQSAALIADAVTHVKMACLDVKAAARVAILDPELTLSQPSGVTACTGMDALSHAVETLVTRKRNAISAMYSRESFRLLLPSLERVVREPGDLDARGRMLLGAALAGVAIEHSMLGAAHAAANPLTARFGVIHGMAVGLMLPHVVRFNAAEGGAARCYAALARECGLAAADDGPETASERLAVALERSRDIAGLPASLGAVGVDEGAFPQLAEDAARQWTAGFNPRSVGAGELRELYRAAGSGARVVGGRTGS